MKQKHEKLKSKREVRLYIGIIVAIVCLIGLELSIVADELYEIQSFTY